MQELDSQQNAVFGVVAGIVEVCIDQPMLYWKNASQQGLPWTLNPRYLYRGLIASITNMATLTGIQYFSTGAIKQIFTAGDETRDLKTWEILSAAFVGGALSGIAGGPIELTMIQQQRFGGNVIQTPYRIVSGFGIFGGIARGMMPSIIREAVFTCGYLGVTPLMEAFIVKNFVHEDTNKGVEYAMRFSASLISGFIASGLSHPADTVKTCMQGDIEQQVYTNVRSTFKIIADRGYSHLYSGFGWRYSRMVMTFFIFNRAQQFIAPAMYPDKFLDKDV